MTIDPRAVFEKLLSNNAIENENGKVTIGGLMEDLNYFDDKYELYDEGELVEPVEGRQYITSAVIKSESGDLFLNVAMGAWTDRQMVAQEFVDNWAYWCGDIGYMELVEITVTEVHDAVYKP